MASATAGNLTSGSLSSDLKELALDLRWSWNHSTDELWGRLDPELWDLTQNPWIVLQTVSRQRIRELSSDAAFCAKVEQLVNGKREREAAPAWFQTMHPGAALTRVAYFSMEFMLSEALPIYSGGLGNVAADQLKAASDLGVPVVGIGLLYQQGYFRQEIDRNGFQQALFPFNDPGQMPIEPLRGADGEWLRIPLRLPEATLWVRTWQVRVGRTQLYLLDTNDAANLPTHRGIASELYGGSPELRLMQEMVLGMTGWRLLSALCLRPEVCHLNEGHAAFLVLERALHYMREHHQPFDVALAVTRAGNLFTTHTPVNAGFDRFAPDLMAQYLRQYAEGDLQIEFEDLMALGRGNPLDPVEPFNMAYLALRGSGHANGVSQLHGKVSRRIFQPLFPRWPEIEVPIGAVTNGVHVPTWDSAEADRLWTMQCGKDRWRGDLESVGRLDNVTDEQLWDLRTKGRQSLVLYARQRLALQRRHQGASPEVVRATQSIFQPQSLTMGFARRFATYKRPNLLLHDPERLVRILTNAEHPVQLILAGKAHPQDQSGQAMIREWSDFIGRPEVRSSVAFLSDYDMLLTSHLIEGVDLWLNTPRRPWEACGTSGMKVLVNGGLNLSELDGWWAEAYSSDVGWALGDGLEHGDDPEWDAYEANLLYDRLEKEVIPAFYARDDRGLPAAWVRKMRASMLRLTPKFSSNRAVREYVGTYYLAAADAYSRRAANNSELGIRLCNWAQSIANKWAGVRFGPVTVSEGDDRYTYRVQIFLGEIEAKSAEVELYAEPRIEGGVFRATMEGPEGPPDADGYVLYSAKVPANRPSRDYTARILPFNPDALVPIEENHILWQK